MQDVAVLWNTLVGKGDNMDEIRLVGFIYKHDSNDYSLWETDAITDEDQEKLYQILQKYDTTGCSIRNVYEQIKAIE